VGLLTLQLNCQWSWNLKPCPRWKRLQVGRLGGYGKLGGGAVGEEIDGHLWMVAVADLHGTRRTNEMQVNWGNKVCHLKFCCSLFPFYGFTCVSLAFRKFPSFLLLVVVSKCWVPWSVQCRTTLSAYLPLAAESFFRTPSQGQNWVRSISFFTFKKKKINVCGFFKQEISVFYGMFCTTCLNKMTSHLSQLIIVL